MPARLYRWVNRSHNICCTPIDVPKPQGYLSHPHQDLHQRYSSMTPWLHLIVVQFCRQQPYPPRRSHQIDWSTSGEALQTDYDLQAGWCRLAVTCQLRLSSFLFICFSCLLPLFSLTRVFTSLQLTFNQHSGERDREGKREWVSDREIQRKNAQRKRK